MKKKSGFIFRVAPQGVAAVRYGVRVGIFLREDAIIKRSGVIAGFASKASRPLHFDRFRGVKSHR